MGERLKLKIITSDGVVYERMADYVQLPLVGGFAGILPGHEPMLAAVTDGPIKCRINGTTEYIYVGRGVADVFENELSIVTRDAKEGREIDLGRAQEAERRARTRMGNKGGGVDEERAGASLARALARQRTYRLSRGEIED